MCFLRRSINKVNTPPALTLLSILEHHSWSYLSQEEYV